MLEIVDHDEDACESRVESTCSKSIRELWSLWHALLFFGIFFKYVFPSGLSLGLRMYAFHRLMFDPILCPSYLSLNSIIAKLGREQGGLARPRKSQKSLRFQPTDFISPASSSSKIARHFAQRFIHVYLADNCLS